MAKLLTTANVRLLLGSLLSQAGGTISAGTNASPAVFTEASHGFSVGDILMISGVTGLTNANGLQKVATVPSANTFTLNGLDSGTAINGNGVFGGSPVCKRITVKLYPADLKDLLNSLARKPYVRDSDASRGQESTIQTLIGA